MYYLNRNFMRAKMMDNLNIPGEIIARPISEAPMNLTDRRRRLWNVETV